MTNPSNKHQTVCYVGIVWKTSILTSDTMTDIVQIQNPKSHMWTLIDRGTGTILEHSDDNTPYPDVAILGEYEPMSHRNTRLVFGYNCIKTGHILRKECLKSVSLCPDCGSMIKSFVFKVKKQGVPQ